MVRFITLPRFMGGPNVDDDSDHDNGNINKVKSMVDQCRLHSTKIVQLNPNQLSTLVYLVKDKTKSDFKQISRLICVWEQLICIVFIKRHKLW